LGGSESIIWLLPVVACALLLRLYRIDWQSSLSDENFSLMLADRSFGKMMAGIIRDAVHPPLHYIALWGWMKLFGFGQLQSRVLSAVCSILSVPMIFLIGRRLLNPRAGLIAAILWRFRSSPFITRKKDACTRWRSCLYFARCSFLCACCKTG
jgi:mannosyltransferase